MSLEGDKHDEHSELFLTDVLESGSSIRKGDGIDYLRDANVAAQDIINLFKSTLKSIELSLSRYTESTSTPRDSGQENINPTFSSEGTRDGGSAESKNNTDLFSEGVSENARKFLTKLKFLLDYTEQRINVSPNQQQERDRKLRHALRSSRKTEIDIKYLSDALATQRSEKKKTLDKLNEELTKCRIESDRKEEGIRNRIARIVNESEIKMTEVFKESVVKREILTSEIEEVKTRLNNLRKNNILMEKGLRDKRCRAEAQLLDSVAKYDSDIGGRHKDMEDLAREFELLNSQRKTLEDDVMINLRKLHDDLQEEKAEALLKIRNEKVLRFVENRAARVIQKSWKAYWERHCAKKKKKSRKKQ